MPNEEAIRRFLYDVYGYGKIGDFLKGEKPDGTSLRDFLAGTIIGTYRTRAISTRTADSSYAQVRVSWPRISKALSTGEAQQIDPIENGRVPYRPIWQQVLRCSDRHGPYRRH